MILDTNALSAFVDGEAGVGEILRRQARAAIPVIVLGEFRYCISESRHWLPVLGRDEHFDAVPGIERESW